MDRSFFDEVLDAFEGFAPGVGPLNARAHRRGLKVWFGDAAREHYEAQLIRGHLADRDDVDILLEIGFHAEHSRPAANDEVLARLTRVESAWRPVLGAAPVAGPFLGGGSWTRVSEVWEAPDVDDPDAAMDVAARLADYVDALEPLRKAEAP